MPRTKQPDTPTPPAELFSIDDADSFKRSFVCEFLAALTASKYAECCSYGRHDELRTPPVEDAADLAESAWSHWCDVIGVAGVSAE